MRAASEELNRTTILTRLINGVYSASVSFIVCGWAVVLTGAAGLSQTTAAPATVQMGQVQEVACASDPQQSYALYLPSTYAPTKRWPIIYFFDPGGRGRYPLDLYKDLAEKHGLIFAGSNNSRNFGSDESKALKAIWTDTHERFALDEHLVYTSGFSGGARIAGAMAMSCSTCEIAGVIAHGAGYPSVNGEAKNKLLYFFAVGNKDFNWPEVITIRREREAKGAPYRMREYSGTHQWAPPDVMEDAIEWMTVRAMQSGAMQKDSALIDRVFRKREAEAEAAEKTSDAMAEMSAYRSLVSDFVGLKDSAQWESKLTALKKSAAWKSAMKDEQEQIAQQATLEGEVSPKVRAYVEGTEPDSDSLRVDILQAIGRMKDEESHSKNEMKRLIASRALSAVWVGGVETGQAELQARHFEKAEACFQLMSRVNDDAWPVLLLAETHASQGKKKEAVKDLQEAVKRGLKDPEAIESDSNLQGLKSDAEFQKPVQGLKHP